MILQDPASKCSSRIRIANYFMLILYETRLQGNLEEIQLAGKNFLGMEGAEKEFLALTAESQRGVVVLRGEELKAQKARLVVRRLLGVDYGDSLMLDTKGTLDSFIQNVDGDVHKNPREVLSFVGAARVANWQPALLDG